MKGYPNTPSPRSVDRIIKKCGENAVKLFGQDAERQPGASSDGLPQGDTSREVALITKKSKKQSIDTPVLARVITPRAQPNNTEKA